MPTRRQLIQKITVNANASSVTFSNIPQNYTDLKIVASMRESIAGNAGSYRLEFNGSSSNLSYRMFYGNGSSALTETLSDRITFYGNGNNATANTYDSSEIYIPNYTSSNLKQISIKWVGERNSATDILVGQTSALWSSSSAINSITIKGRMGDTTTIMAGSTIYLYGITQVPIIRGGEVSIAGGYKIHTFRSTASLQVIEGGQVEYLVVAGGGGGASGGGGAGGYRSSVAGELSGAASIGASLTLSQSTTVTVGGGGAGGNPTSGDGATGSASSLGSVSTSGGGGGGRFGISGLTGGSGGGGGASSGGAPLGGAGTTSEGRAGGNTFVGSPSNAGGGGGANTAGSNATSSSGGPGGSGISSGISGSAVGRGGGGGGGADPGRTGGTATDGGGAGTVQGGTPASGSANTGGGGGGINDSSTGGSGGSGIVIIRYPYDGN